MLHNRTEGIWCREDKTWYYLESGEHLLTNSMVKLKNILLSRGLNIININYDERNTETIKLMDYATALECDYKIEPVYISKHVKDIMEAEKAKEEASEVNPWS